MSKYDIDTEHSRQLRLVTCMYYTNSSGLHGSRMINGWVDSFVASFCVHPHSPICAAFRPNLQVD